MESLLPYALKYLDAGLSILPARQDKGPAIDPQTGAPLKWGKWTKKPMTADDAEYWWKNGSLIGVIGGPVSGNLEMIDLDHPGIAKEWFALLKSWNLEPLLRRLVIESTQTPGRYHVSYRHEGKPEGPLKLALRPATEAELLLKPEERVKCKIETKGDGGYCVVAPSPGYKLTQGDWLNIPTITADEREALLSACRYFNEVVRLVSKTPEGDRIGDDYNARASIDEILIPNDWKRCKGGDLYWTRPGKDHGVSASWNYQGNRHFTVFTSNAPGLEPGSYDLFGLYARLFHGGDFKAAARAAQQAGYGESASKTIRRIVQKAEREPRSWIWGDRVIVKETAWLFDPYIPKGELTFLAGDPGEGKSSLAQAIAAHVSTGTPINGEPIEKGRVIFLSAEQSVSKVTIPRFISMGADLSQILLPDDENDDGSVDPFVLDEEGIEELKEQAKEIKASLIVIDTVTAYIEASRDMSTANQVREWMRRLTDIARLTDAAILIIGHTNKSTGQKALYRISGSMDFVGASRSVLMCGHDPDNPETKGSAHIKSNVGRLGETIGYCIGDDGSFSWTNASDLSADRMFEAPQSREARTTREECTEWLEQLLKDNPMYASDVIAQAKEHGYSRRALFDAKKDCRVKSRKGTSGAWSWYMPTDDGSDFEG